MRSSSAALCQICKRRPQPATALLPARLVPAEVQEIIRSEHADWSPDGFICVDDLDRYRNAYLRRVVEASSGELSALSASIEQNLRDLDLQSRNLNAEFDRKLTTGERVADRVAEFGGSWVFIGFFGAVLFVWIVLNAGLLLRHPFDPFPFILLNLILSCVAALQAPVIMMSQNRQEAKDRLRAEHDYRVNLRAELEIRHLHTKLDYLLAHQFQRLLEVQEVQVELMEELRQTRSAPAKPAP